MVPIITLTYIVSIFFGYYGGADLRNQVKIMTEFNEVKDRLDSK
jgi:hypothetical protein